MPGKVKAALLGASIGAIIAVLIELIAVASNDETFFGSEQSWIVLAVAVVAFTWTQLRAYDRKSGERHDDNTGDQSTPR